jgi:tetratricopeptide (TPR) repeat protein
VTDVEQSGGSRGDERWFLTDQREFLERSLDDAARERDAGDLSDEDYAVLLARDSGRLDDVEAELAALGPESTPGRSGGAEDPGQAEPRGAPEAAVPRASMSPWRKVGVVLSFLLILLGVGLLLTHVLQSAQAGQPLSGSVTQSRQQLIAQQLNQALEANNSGDVGTALNLYDKVLTEDPSNANALAYAGYLQWSIGAKSHVANLVKIGRAEIEKALQVAPTNYEAHLFDGLVLANQDHDYAAAVAQFNEYLADNPPIGLLPQAAADAAPSYKAVGQPLPMDFVDALPATTTTTTTTTTSVP